MKQFYIRIVIFFIPILVVLLLLEPLIRNLPQELSYKSNYLKNYGGDLETLILGSSHSLFGLNPEFFKNKTFNASALSQSIKLDKIILAQNLTYLPKLKTVILPVSSFSLYYELETGVDAWRKYEYSFFYDYKPGLLEKFSYKSYSHFLAKPNYRKALTKIYHYYIAETYKPTWSILGWSKENFNTKHESAEVSGKKAAVRHNIDMQSNHYPFIMQQLESIIRLCEQNNINLIIFTPPAWKSYRQQINKNKMNASINSMKILAKAHPHVSYLNYFDDPSFEKKNYMDGDHLNESGAIKLSISLDSFIQELNN